MRLPILLIALTAAVVSAAPAPALAESDAGLIWRDEMVDLNVVSADVEAPGGIVVLNPVDR
ncbi:hypothetical protein ACFXKD_14280 [Nocardiopsis aegyptia]|uniref:hypothetical protein n=1 Tax=Nocardiopsis aegyptia TaxID=220378 RepID=UPI00366D93AA